MKNNYDDIILKYLSDLLGEKEKVEFEEELKKNPELNKRFEHFQNTLGEIKDLVSEDSGSVYFSNLVPKVRDKIESDKNVVVPAYAKKAIAFGLALVLLFIVVFINTEGDIDLNFESLTVTIDSTDSDELNDFVDLRYSDIEVYDLISGIELENYSEAINEQLSENLDDLYDYSDYAYLGINGINGISDSEEDEIFESLIDKKIL